MQYRAKGTTQVNHNLDEKLWEDFRQFCAERKLEDPEQTIRSNMEAALRLFLDHHAGRKSRRK